MPTMEYYVECWHSYSVFGRSRVQISGRRSPIPTEISVCFLSLSRQIQVEYLKQNVTASIQFIWNHPDIATYAVQKAPIRDPRTEITHTFKFTKQQNV
jgi:hypothetical protein